VKRGGKEICVSENGIDNKNGKKNIYLLGGSSFFNDVGSEMITPILPFYINALGGGGVAIGLVSGLREGLSSLLKLLGGWASDLNGKRLPFVFLGYFISAIFKILLFFANTWQAVVAFVSLERFGKARDAPRDAIIAVSTNNRGRGFGINQAMDKAGGIVGMIIVILILWKLNLEFKTIIIIAGFVSAISLIPLFFVKEPKIKIKGDKSLFSGIKHLDSRLKYFIFVSCIFTIANFGLQMFLLLMAKDITGSMLTAMALFTLFYFTCAIFTIPFGSWSDRIGRKRVLGIGYGLFIFVGLGFVFLVDGITSLILLFIAYGLVYAMTQSNQLALVSDLSGEHKGTALGFYQFMIGIVNIPAGLLAGYLWDISPKTMFIYITIIGIFALIFLNSVKESKIRNRS